MAKKIRDSMIFLNEHMQMAARLLSERERGRLFEALRLYVLEGALPDLTKEKVAYCTVFDMMRESQDRFAQRYEMTCEQNSRNANKRWHGSALPPDAKHANTIQSKTIQSNPIQSGGSAGEDGFFVMKETEETGVPGCAWK